MEQIHCVKKCKYDKVKESIRVQKWKIQCICGAICQRRWFKKHLKSPKHSRHMLDNESLQIIRQISQSISKQ